MFLENVYRAAVNVLHSARVELTFFPLPAVEVEVYGVDMIHEGRGKIGFQIVRKPSGI